MSVNRFTPAPRAASLVFWLLLAVDVTGALGLLWFVAYSLTYDGPDRDVLVTSAGLLLAICVPAVLAFRLRQRGRWGWAIVLAALPAVPIALVGVGLTLLFTLGLGPHH